jgi:hypothetical protein
MKDDWFLQDHAAFYAGTMLQRAHCEKRFATGKPPFFFYSVITEGETGWGGGLWAQTKFYFLQLFSAWIFINNSQHCFVCRHSDSSVSKNAGIELKIVKTLALEVRRSNHSARPPFYHIDSQKCAARFFANFNF